MRPIETRQNGSGSSGGGSRCPFLPHRTPGESVSAPRGGIQFEFRTATRKAGPEGEHAGSLTAGPALKVGPTCCWFRWEEHGGVPMAPRFPGKKDRLERGFLVGRARDADSPGPRRTWAHMSVNGRPGRGTAGHGRAHAGRSTAAPARHGVGEPWAERTLVRFHALFLAREDH